MTGPQPDFLQLQNAVATQNLLESLGITAPVRFAVHPAVIPVAVMSTQDPTKVDRLAFGSVNVSAVAAQVSQSQLFNPAGSGVAIHVDSAYISVPSAASFTVRIFDTALTTLSSESGYRDRRLDGSPAGQVRGSSVAVVQGTVRLRLQVPANESVLIPLDMFLGVGQGVHFACSTANLDSTTDFFWEEARA